MLNPIRIFSGSFSGTTLYKNEAYTSPNEIRREMKLASASSYTHKLNKKQQYSERQQEFELSEDELNDVFKAVSESESENESDLEM